MIYENLHPYEYCIKIMKIPVSLPFQFYYQLIFMSNYAVRNSVLFTLLRMYLFCKYIFCCIMCLSLFWENDNEFTLTHCY